MDNKAQRYLYGIIAILLVLIVSVFAAYFFSKKEQTEVEAPSKLEVAAPSLEELKTFDLGEFLANPREKGFHIVKTKVSLVFVGGEYYENLLKSRKDELRDEVQRILMRATRRELQDDFINQFLHRDVEARINSVMKSEGEKARVYKVVIPEFLIQ